MLINYAGKETNLTGHICKLIIDASGEGTVLSMKIFTGLGIPHAALKPENPVNPVHISKLKELAADKKVNWSNIVSSVKKLGYELN